MKFAITILTFNLLCVWCFGFENCEDDDEPLCPSFSQIIPEVAATYPYEARQTINYIISSAEGERLVTGEVTRVENQLARRFECSEVNEFVLSIVSDIELLHIRSFIIGDTLQYRHLITRNGVGEVKILEVGVEILGPGVSRLVVAQPGQRIVADTTLEAGSFQNILVTEYGGNELVRTVYLTQAEGFVQLDYRNDIRIYQVE